mgnify:CR=1 FL=1
MAISISVAPLSCIAVVTAVAVVAVVAIIAVRWHKERVLLLHIVACGSAWADVCVCRCLYLCNVCVCVCVFVCVHVCVILYWEGAHDGLLDE